MTEARRRPAPHVVVALAGADTVLYDPRRHQAHLLNQSAAAIWRLLGNGSTGASIVDDVAAVFAVDAESVRADVVAVIRELDELELFDKPRSGAGDEPTPDAATQLSGLHGIAPVGATRSAPPAGDWAHTSATFQAIGLRFAVVADRADVVAQIDRVLAPLRVPERASLWYSIRCGDPDAGDSTELRIGDHEPLPGVRTPGTALGRLLWDYNHRAITTAEGLVLLHASAVLSSRGVIAFPAPSGSGKSTLATALAAHGYGYVTDECVAVVPGTGQVMAYPKPIGLDPGSWDLFPDLDLADDLLQPSKRWVVGSSLGPGTRCAHPEAGASLPLLAVVFPRYASGADSPLEPLGTGEAVVRLARNTFRLADHPDARLADLVALASSVPAFALDVDDLDRACEVIDGLVDA